MEQYKQSVARQHAPEQLIQDTLDKINSGSTASLRPASKIRPLKYIAAAAVLVLVIGITLVTTVVQKNSQPIEFAAIESVQSDSQRNFGTIDKKRKITAVQIDKEKQVTLEIYEDPSFSVAEYEIGKTYTIAGNQVYFTTDGENCYASCITTEGVLFIKGSSMAEDDFASAVKQYLK